MKGQLSISFVMRVGIGLMLIAALAYATLSLEDSLKKESQKQTLISVSEYVAGQTLSMLQYLAPGESANQTFRLPLSRDYYSGQYAVQLQDIEGVAYVAVQSTNWPDMVARQPLFLNTSILLIDTEATFPPGLCVEASRNTTHYTMSIAC